MKRLTRNQLDNLGACDAATRWIDRMKQAGKTAADCWQECFNPDWMLWLIRTLPVENETVIYRRLALAFLRFTPLSDGRKVVDLVTDPVFLNLIKLADQYVAESSDGFIPEDIRRGALNRLGTYHSERSYAERYAAECVYSCVLGLVGAAKTESSKSAWNRGATDLTYSQIEAAQANAIRTVFPAWRDVLAATGSNPLVIDSDDYDDE